MDRQPPRSTSDEIDLYIRTYYSLLRSSGDVRVRALEEAHIYSNSSLHAGARDPEPDEAAFAYSAARLPACMPWIRRVVLGQNVDHFEAAELSVGDWDPVPTRGRRRASRWNGGETLAVFISSASDIDDLIPIVAAYQIEWNKMHSCLTRAGIRAEDLDTLDDERIGTALRLEAGGLTTLHAALGPDWKQTLALMASRECKLALRLLYGSFTQYQRSGHRWWSGIENHYSGKVPLRRRPIYFVSANTHSLVNLVGGYAQAQRDNLISFARESNFESLAEPLAKALATDDTSTATNLFYYLLRTYLDRDQSEERIAAAQSYESESGIQTIDSPGLIDVSAQLLEIAQLKPSRFDPRVQVNNADVLADSDAIIVNIDYPLGLAAYHHLLPLIQGVGEIRGIYVMGKAATLNGRVGDVMISNAVYDEHSKNTYLFRNCFAAGEVQEYMRYGTVLDNQKAVTVRSAFLQNRHYMSAFYQGGYTVMEMEAGPYLSAIYEAVSPNRHPENEVVHMSNTVPFDFGLLHYASDTPYSRRQNLLSKSLSFFGVESTYAATIAIVRRILTQELARLGK